MRSVVCLFIILSALTLAAAAAEKSNEKPIPPNSKLYIAPMNGFEADLRSAMETKHVPVQLVSDRYQADFELKGISETQKAGTAKKLIMGSWHSKEEASIQVYDIKTSEMVYAYSYHNENSMHGKRSSAESIAKHLKEKIESLK